MRRDAEEVRRQAEYLEELRRQTISSPRMDGMTHGSPQDDAMARLVIRRQQAQERLDRAQRRLDRSIRDARRILSRLDVRMARFLDAYYIAGDTIEEAARFAGVCLRTGNNYLRMVAEKDTKEHPEGCFFQSGICVWDQVVFGTKSSLRVMPIPAARRWRVLRDGLPHPRSSLEMSP